MRISDWSSDVCSADLEVSSATGRKGNVLYEIVRTLDGALDEARFVDQVSRNLAAGRFLLTVVGDGITEGTQRIGAFLTTQPGLSFDFALVAMAQYHFHDPLGGEIGRAHVCTPVTNAPLV